MGTRYLSTSPKHLLKEKRNQMVRGFWHRARFFRVSHSFLFWCLLIIVSRIIAHNAPLHRGRGKKLNPGVVRSSYSINRDNESNLLAFFRPSSRSFWLVGVKFYPSLSKSFFQPQIHSIFTSYIFSPSLYHSLNHTQSLRHTVTRTHGHSLTHGDTNTHASGGIDR